MKKRMRRFDEGGYSEDEDKAEGLRRSAGEKVGLLERLRMGNIDDPTSEAYRRFGAGRARAEREAAQRSASAYTDPNRARLDTLAEASTPTPSVMLDELEEANKRAPIPMEPGPRAPMPSARPVARPPSGAMPSRPAAPTAPARPTAMPSTPPTREAGAGRGFVNPSVAELQKAAALPKPTPEQLARYNEMMRPGRDAIEGVYPELALAGAAGPARYLAQNLIKPVGRAAAEGMKAGAADAAIAREIARGAESAAGSAARTTIPKTAPSAARFTPKQEMESAEAAVRGAASRKAVQSKRAEGQRKTAEAMERDKPVLKTRPGKSKPSSKTKYDEDMAGVEFGRGGKARGFAKGGSVSASSRGDGIAMRGKTRGRIY